MFDPEDKKLQDGPLADLLCEDCIVRVAEIFGRVVGTLTVLGAPGPGALNALAENPFPHTCGLEHSSEGPKH